jgi:hypothetical protein
VNSIDNNYSLTRSGSNRGPNFSRSGGSTSGHHNVKEKSTPQHNLLEIVIEIPTSNLPTYNRRHYEHDDPNDKLSPRQKMKNLALQLGESCLAADLSALINQKRDMELEKLTREKIVKTKGRTKTQQPDKIEYINRLRNSEKIESDGEDDSPTKSNDVKSNQLKNLLNKKPLFKTSDENLPKDNTKMASMISQNALDYTKDFKRNFVFSFDNIAYQNHNFNNYDKSYKNYIKLREIITNFILSCLKEYSFEELYLLKINTNLIYSYLLLPTVDAIRRKLERKSIENLESLTDYDKEYRVVLSDGCFNINENRENLFKTFVINNYDKSQTFNEDMLRSVRPSKNKYITTLDFVSRAERSNFDSILSLNMEEDISSSLSLKSEYEALFEIVSYHTLNIENIIKQQNFQKEIFLSTENPKPDNQEFWNSGICFNLFLNVSPDVVRKHIDPFLDKVKNRIMFILKNNDFGEKKVWKFLRYQLDILREYVNKSNTKVIPVHIVFEISEILIILKRNIIGLMIKIGPFDINNNDIKLLERDHSEYKIPEEFTELYFTYLDTLSKLIVKTNLATCDRFLNETFINCPYFIEVLKFFGGYVFMKDLYDVYSTESTSKSSRLKKPNVKYTLINFIKELDADTSGSLKNLLETYKDYQNYTLMLITYCFNCSMFFHRIVKRESLDKAKNEDRDVSKYWINSLREFLKYMYHFVNTKKGLIFVYLTSYASYIKIKGVGGSESNRHEKQTVLPNFSLTRAILYLQHSLFDFSSRFSFIVNESTSIDFIRLHYISFIKLYNKNLDFSSKLGDISKVLDNCDKSEKRKKMKALIRDIYNDQSYLQIVVFLCKFHLRCLFALAKNRNIDVTNKFYQLKIVDFMIKELDLEHDASEKVYKIKNFSKNNVDKDDGDIETLKINFNNLPQTKDDIMKLKYKPKQDTVYEIRDDDASKYSQKSSLRNNNFMQGNELGVKGKFGSFSNIGQSHENTSEREEKNIIIEKLNDISEFEKREEIQEEEKEGANDDLSDYNSDDLSDDSIMLVELKPKKNPYEDKIPKLNFMPTVLNLEGSTPSGNFIAQPVSNIQSRPASVVTTTTEQIPKEGSSRPLKGAFKSLEFDKKDEKLNFQNEDVLRDSRDREVRSPSINMTPLNLNFKNNAKELNNSERKDINESASKIPQLRLNRSQIGSNNNSKLGGNDSNLHERYDSTNSNLLIKSRISMDLTNNIQSLNNINSGSPHKVEDKNESYRSNSQVKKTLMKNRKKKSF